MAKAKNESFENAADTYDKAAAQYTGKQGYDRGVSAANIEGKNFAKQQLDAGADAGMAQANRAASAGRTQAINNAAASANEADVLSRAQNARVNEEAQKYAGQQAANAAAGAQSQATTAARAAGMNKAQAAMMGSQQNANAYQNAYGNAFNTQLGNASSAYENQANRTNSGMTPNAALAAQQMNNATNIYGQNMTNQQNAQTASNQAMVSAAGTGMGAAQTEGQAEYDRTWGNWGNGMGIAGALLKPFSDEELKHYKECSKKVTIRSPKSIQKLKFVQKEN